METKKPRYKSELNKPIRVGSIPIKATNEEQALVYQVIEQEMIAEKLPLLFQHYGIPEGDFFSLALALANDHVPGFQVKQTALKLKHGNWGAVIQDTKPTKWPRERLLRLLNANDEAKQTRGFSTDREALQFLMQQPKEEWGRPDDRRDEQRWLETLESRLQDAKRIKREEQGGGPALDPASAAILRELEETARLATATVSAATVYATLPVELRFTALCLPLSSKIPERGIDWFPEFRPPKLAAPDSE